VQVLVLFNEELLALCGEGLSPQPIALEAGEVLYWLNKPEGSTRWSVSPERIRIVPLCGAP